jgi:PIN domain nuclease of toxin-antitoxin system
MTRDDPDSPADRPAPARRPKALDASALAALVFDEPGSEMVADVIAEGAVVSTVNLSEVAKILINRDLDPGRLLPPICDQVTVEPFTPADALCAASLYPQTAQAGLSLGDRACLALAKRLDAVAVTAEHAWAQISVGVEVQLIRELHPPDR